MWVALMFLGFAICALVSACFPKWDVRWGGRGGRNFHKQVPVSVEGRVAFGILLAWFSGAGFIASHRPSTGPWVLAIGVFVLIGVFGLIGMYFVYARDRRRCNSK
jgi:hypothetical protein